MITRRTITCGLLALVAGGAAATTAPADSAPAPTHATQAVPFRSLQSGSFAELVSARSNQPFLLILWSITCGPCRDEFTLLREVRASYPQLPLVLISTDDINDRDVAATALGNFGMTGEESWIFADDAQRLRYEIDPAWYGELPRAYFYDADHQRKGVSGKLSREQIETWLANTTAEAARAN
ncbi:MAG: TlpA family protein disulfide reductase [Gammaproteobacteria bacterium]